MRPAQRQRTLSGTSRPHDPTIIAPEELESIFGREIFTQSDYESLQPIPPDLREGEVTRSLYFPRPELSVKDLARDFQFPKPVPYVNVPPEEHQDDAWSAGLQEVGWCRIDLHKKESAELDVSRRGAAQLADRGYRLPNAFEMILAAIILHRKRDPLAQTVLRIVTSDHILEEHDGNVSERSIVVVLHGKWVRTYSAGMNALKDYPVFHAKIG